MEYEISNHSHWAWKLLGSVYHAFKAFSTASGLLPLICSALSTMICLQKKQTRIARGRAKSRRGAWNYYEGLELEWSGEGESS